MLGLVPGWGGAWLVPNLVGADKAVTLILENPLNKGKTLGGRAAYDLGLADAVFERCRLPRAVAALGGRVLDAARSPSSAPRSTGARPGTPRIARGRAASCGQDRRRLPRRGRAVELIAGARDADPRRRASRPRTTPSRRCRRPPELIASLYAFDLVQKRAKRPAGAPDRSLARPVTKVGIVGAGLMASQLALLFVRRLEVPVVLTDLDQERADKGVAYVHAEIDKLLAKGRINQDKANRHKALVSGETDKQVAFGDADFVIEAVFEEMSVKKTVFADVEKVV